MSESGGIRREWFIANLPFDTNKSEFERFFQGILEPHRVELTDVRFMRTDPPELRFKGWGFAEVMLPSLPSEDEILDALKGNAWGGRDLVVKKATPRPPKPSRSSLAHTRTEI